MNSGRDLDCEVARKLFRYVVMLDPAAGTACTWNVQERRLVAVPPYSTDVDSAYLVLTHMRSLGWACSIASNTDHGPAEWTVTCSHPGSRLVAQASTHSMAEAIALAAVKVASLTH